MKFKEELAKKELRIIYQSHKVREPVIKEVVQEIVDLKSWIHNFDYEIS